MSSGLDRLQPCASRPNCVSSLAPDAAHRIEPFHPRGNADDPLAAVREIVIAWPGARVVEEATGYLHMECRSRLFRFVDDLELAREETTGTIHVRSAARIGYTDFGVNRRRVERLRRRLRTAGAIA